MQKEKSNKGSIIDTGKLEEVAKLFKILSEEARLRLLSILMDGGRTVGELVEASGLKQGNVSKHLKILLDADLVKRKKEGNYVRYSIAEPLIFDLCALVCRQVETAAAEKLRTVMGDD